LSVRYLIDTNVISETFKQHPDDNVVRWFNRYGAETGLPTPVLVELWTGAFKLPAGSRRQVLESTIRAIEQDYAGRVFALDAQAAYETARFIDARTRAGRPVMDFMDAQIAGIAQSYGKTIVTCNTRDFEGLDLELENPWGQGA
jgi:toxin FitB